MKFHRLVAVPLVVALSLAAGCTNPGDAESNIAPLPATDVNPRDHATLTPGGELRLAVSELGSLNPMSSDQKDGLSAFNRAVFPTFFDYSDTGSAEPNPNFVESFQEVSSSPTVVNLKLNPKATWADGAPIVASDVIATWRACNGMSQGFRCRPELQFAQIADVTTGATPQEVTLTFKSAYPAWPHVFEQVSVLRADSVQDPTTFNTGWSSPKKGWSAGPFAVDKADQRSITATPDPAWWADKPLLERITVRAIPRAEQAQAFADSAVDVIDLAPTKEAYDTVVRHTDYNVRRAGALGWRQLVFNPQSSSPVAEPEVRRAIAMALNRSGMGMAAYAGMSVNTSPQNSHLYATQQDGYADNAKATKTDNDLGRARKTLDRAGWKGSGNQVRDKGGRKLTVKYAALAGVPDAKAEAEAAKRQLAKVGIDLQVDQVPLSEADGGTVLSGGSFEMIAVNVDGSRVPAQVAADNYASGADRNFSRVATPELDAKIEAMRTEPDRARRNEIGNDIDRALWTNLTTAPLYQLPQLTLTRTRLANYGSFGLATPRWENVGYLG